jgi:hypothetical protein
MNELRTLGTMGFPADWMRPTLKKLMLPETLSPPNGKMDC